MLTRTPGRKKVERAIATPPERSAPHGPLPALPLPTTTLARAIPLPTRVKPQAKKTRMNFGERNSPRYLFCSGRIRHGPTFRFLERPREEVMIDVEKATKKRRELRLAGLFQSTMISLPGDPSPALTAR